jgi:hypothetical protein
MELVPSLSVYPLSGHLLDSVEQTELEPAAASFFEISSEPSFRTSELPSNAHQLET